MHVRMYVVCVLVYVLCYCAESVRASSPEVWMHYLKNVILAVNGLMGRWTQKPVASIRLVFFVRAGVGVLKH